MTSDQQQLTRLSEQRKHLVHEVQQALRSTDDLLGAEIEDPNAIEALDQLRGKLAKASERIADGISHAFDLISAELRERERQREEARGGLVDFTTGIADNVRFLRNAAGWTQAQLAEAMDRVGFPWRRITVAEVETSKRRLSLEELLALAGLFAVPMVELLRVTEADIAWPQGGRLNQWQLWEALVGGPGGPTWEPGVIVTGAPVGEDDWRPARALWKELGQVTGEPGGDPPTEAEILGRMRQGRVASENRKSRRDRDV